ncbi:MAG: hypothetical protein HDT29_03230 [Clostridiales bacterium]|nr:hypothetical protein [Clostridiales bacterium]
MFGRRARKKAEQEALRKMMEEAEANRRAAQEAEYAAEQEAKIFYESEIIFDDDEFDNDPFYDFQQYDEPQFDVQNDEPDVQNDEPIDSFESVNPNGGTVVALPIHEDKPAEQEQETENVVEETAVQENDILEPVEAEKEEEPVQEIVEEILPEEPIRETVQDAVQEPIREEVQEAESTVETEQEPIMQEPVQETVPETEQEPIYAEQEQQAQEYVWQSEYAEESTAEHGDEPEIRYIVDGPVEDDELVKPAKLVKLPNLIDYMLTRKMSKSMKITIATLLLGAYQKYKDIPEEREIVKGCMKKVLAALMK